MVEGIAVEFGTTDLLDPVKFIEKLSKITGKRRWDLGVELDKVEEKRRESHRTSVGVD